MHPPNLDAAALTHQLARLFASGRERRPLIAVYGTCDDPRPLDLPGVGRFDVVRATSQLDLRAHLPDPTLADPARTVYLVPWTDKLPLDVASRFSRDGEVFRVDEAVRLSRLFTAPFETVDADAVTSRLAAWLLHTPPAAPLPSPGGRLTHHALWTTWLRHTWGLDLDDGGLSTLLAWAAANAHGPRLAAQLGHSAATGVQAELETLLSRRFGEPAPAILRAWLHERGTSLLGFAVLCETLARRTDDRALATWLALKAEPFLGARTDAGQRRTILTRLADLVAPTLAELHRTNQRDALRAALDAADTLADEHVHAALIASARLLSSWHMRLDALGKLLADAARAPDDDALARADEALRSLENHDRPKYSRDSRAAAELTRAEAGVRLLAWLVRRTDDPATSADALARWYIDEGSWLDRARQTARGADTGPFGAGVTAILARVDDARRSLDRTFAASLVDRRPGPAIPLADALERVALGFLRGRPSRRLLTIVLADMAWTHALELLGSLDDDASRWGPLAWHGLDTPVPCPAVLATIPAISPLCRATLLSGRPAPRGVLPTTGAEPKRLAEHRTLTTALSGNAPLFIRPAHIDSAGADVLAQIRDPQTRLVTIVLDTHAAAHSWRARAIRPLFELLDAAQSSRRAVLLTSDHGRIPGEPPRLKTPARWRPWTADTTIQPHETAFPSESAWTPRGARGVLVVHDDTHRPESPGDHGGATLAEVVTPMTLLGWEAMADEHDDPALKIHAAAPPRWWHLHVDVPPVPLTPPPRRKLIRPQLEPQLALPTLAPPPDDPSTHHPLTRRLLASPIFEARIREPSQRVQAEQLLEALLRHGNAASDELLGALLRIPARRVGGFVARASEVLNVDGYPVVHHDPISRRAELHVERLQTCFELESP